VLFSTIRKDAEDTGTATTLLDLTGGGSNTTDPSSPHAYAMFIRRACGLVLFVYGWLGDRHSHGQGIASNTPLLLYDSKFLTLYSKSLKTVEI